MYFEQFNHWFSDLHGSAPEEILTSDLRKQGSNRHQILCRPVNVLFVMHGTWATGQVRGSGGKAVYRSREAQAKVCEERLPRRGRSSSTEGARCDGSKRDWPKGRSVSTVRCENRRMRRPESSKAGV